MDAFVAEHLKGVSRTYALVIPMLPRGLDHAVGLAYLLMRIVDTLEDSPQLPDPERRRLLQGLDQALLNRAETAPPELLRPLGALAAERALMGQVPQVLTRLNALDPVYQGAAHAGARRMIAGVLAMLQRSAQTGLPYPAIRDAAELREYCYHVAGVVGLMLCEMMAHYLRQPALRRLDDLAVELGIGLQLVNILKDFVKDGRHGRRYLPIDDGDQLNTRQLYRFVLDEARTSLTRGAEFVLALPAAARELRCFCGLPIAWGAMTLARAERDASQAKIGRGAILSSIQLFRRLVSDDLALRSWLQRILQPGAAPTM